MSQCFGGRMVAGRVHHSTDQAMWKPWCHGPYANNCQASLETHTRAKAVEERLRNRTRIWVDFENAPHVLVLAPIVDRLREAGFSDFLFTARDFSYTVELSRQFGFAVNVAVLRGHGRNGFDRAGRIVWRAVELSWRLRSERWKIGMALSHGSRSQILAACIHGIPSIALDD